MADKGKEKQIALDSRHCCGLTNDFMAFFSAVKNPLCFHLIFRLWTIKEGVEEEYTYTRSGRSNILSSCSTITITRSSKDYLLDETTVQKIDNTYFGSVIIQDKSVHHGANFENV